ncbi:hypothetical protein DXG03_001484 [Asterophora parasitica]|uniref:Uncharacterized protein n=1 Tax=Asterophora parasitica TaxID=117018 RepID=A0A9P7KBJ9_9AGAR|nr:hypothetical protein DXG03_001484 [Asterophora parasitica]
MDNIFKLSKHTGTLFLTPIRAFVAAIGTFPFLFFLLLLLLLPILLPTFLIAPQDSLVSSIDAFTTTPTYTSSSRIATRTTGVYVDNGKVVNLKLVAAHIATAATIIYLLLAPPRSRVGALRGTLCCVGAVPRIAQAVINTLVNRFSAIFSQPNVATPPKLTHLPSSPATILLNAKYRHRSQHATHRSTLGATFAWAIGMDIGTKILDAFIARAFGAIAAVWTIVTPTIQCYQRAYRGNFGAILGTWSFVTQGIVKRATNKLYSVVIPFKASHRIECARSTLSAIFAWTAGLVNGTIDSVLGALMALLTIMPKIQRGQNKVHHQTFGARIYAWWPSAYRFAIDVNTTPALTTPALLDLATNVPDREPTVVVVDVFEKYTGRIARELTALSTSQRQEMADTLTKNFNEAMAFFLVALAVKTIADEAAIKIEVVDTDAKEVDPELEITLSVPLPDDDSIDDSESPEAIDGKVNEIKVVTVEIEDAETDADAKEVDPELELALSVPLPDDDFIDDSESPEPVHSVVDKVAIEMELLDTETETDVKEVDPELELALSIPLPCDDSDVDNYKSHQPTHPNVTRESEVIHTESDAKDVDSEVELTPVPETNTSIDDSQRPESLHLVVEAKKVDIPTSPSEASTLAFIALPKVEKSDNNDRGTAEKSRAVAPAAQEVEPASTAKPPKPKKVKATAPAATSVALQGLGRWSNPNASSSAPAPSTSTRASRWAHAHSSYLWSNVVRQREQAAAEGMKRKERRHKLAVGVERAEKAAEKVKRLIDEMRRGRAEVKEPVKGAVVEDVGSRVEDEERAEVDLMFTLALSTPLPLDEDRLEDEERAEADMGLTLALSTPLPLDEEDWMFQLALSTPLPLDEDSLEDEERAKEDLVLTLALSTPLPLDVENWMFQLALSTLLPLEEEDEVDWVPTQNLPMDDKQLSLPPDSDLMRADATYPSVEDDELILALSTPLPADELESRNEEPGLALGPPADDLLKHLIDTDVLDIAHMIPLPLDESMEAYCETEPEATESASKPSRFVWGDEDAEELPDLVFPSEDSSNTIAVTATADAPVLVTSSTPIIPANTDSATTSVLVPCTKTSPAHSAITTDDWRAASREREVKRRLEREVREAQLRLESEEREAKDRAEQEKRAKKQAKAERKRTKKVEKEKEKYESTMARLAKEMEAARSALLANRR